MSSVIRDTARLPSVDTDAGGIFNRTTCAIRYRSLILFMRQWEGGTAPPLQSDR